MQTLTYDALAEAQGADLGHGRWIPIDQARISAFAETTEDRQWIHVDPLRAADGPFGGTIAHGYLTLSLVAAYLDERFHVEGAGMAINYGCDRVRFPQPVVVGSRVRGQGQVVAVRAVPHAVQLTVRVTMQIEDVDRPACVADVLVRVVSASTEPAS